MKHRFKRNHVCRIPLDCDRLLAASVDGKDVIHKYNFGAQAFLFGFDDVAEFPDRGAISLEYEADGKTITTQITLEAC